MLTPTAWIKARRELCAFADALGLGELIEERVVGNKDNCRIYSWQGGAVTLRLSPARIRNLETTGETNELHG